MARSHRIEGDVEEVLHRVRVPSYAIDEHGIIRWLNEAALELVGDVRGKQSTSVVAPEETHRAREAFAKHMIGSEDVNDSLILFGQDGDRVRTQVMLNAFDVLALYVGRKAEEREEAG